MKLYLNATSPFARFARIVALEKHLEIELCWCDPWANDSALLNVNPLGRIPALQTQEGLNLSESLLIALYLDQQGTAAPLLPANQWSQQLHQLGLGIGLMEAAFNTVIARKHGLDQGELSVRRDQAIKRTLTQLDNEAPNCSPLTLGALSIGVALDYLAFRLPEYQWSTQHPSLAKLHNAFAALPSATHTAFS